MLRIPNLEEIHRKLLEVPSLIDGYARRDAAFLDDTLAWFSSVERILINNQSWVAAELSSMRGTIISARRGHHDEAPEALRRTSRRRVMEATAERMLRKALETVPKRFERDVAMIGRAEDSARELVIVARQLGLIAHEQGTTGGMAADRSLWRVLAEHEHTAKYTVYMRSVVGLSDSILLLDRVITR